MNATPEPADPFSPEELEAIVADALAARDDHPDAQESDEDILTLVAEVEHYESFQLSPLRIRMVIQWPAGKPEGVDENDVNMMRRMNLAHMATRLAETINEQLQEEIPVDPEEL